MSRIGKKPIEIPSGVKAEVTDKEVVVSGPKGELRIVIHPEISMEQKDGKIIVSPKNESFSKKGKGLWGLYRALTANMVEGVSKGFEKKLEIEGVGFKAQVENGDLVLSLGFAHPVRVQKIEGVTFVVEKNVVTVSGIEKEKVGFAAALIRKQKKAEPYKGKGIKYQGEVIRRKEGKKVVASK